MPAGVAIAPSFSRRTRWLGVLAAVVVLCSSIVVGTLAVTSLRRANNQFAGFAQGTVTRLVLLAEVQGQLARLNDGVVTLLAPDAPPVLRVRGEADARRAGATLDELMARYRELVAGNPAEEEFTALVDSWRLFYNTVTVHVLGLDPLPGLPLNESPIGVGALGVAISDGLDRMSSAERNEAERISQEQRALFVATTRQVTLAIVLGLGSTAAVVVVALRLERARRRGERRFRVLTRESTDVISVVDRDGRHTYLSPSVSPVMGYQPEQLIGGSFLDLLGQQDHERAQRMFSTIADNAGQEFRFDVQLLHADGTLRWHEAIARNMLTDPAVRGIVLNHRDITERREFQDLLAFESTHDPLTGLANRSVFLDQLAAALQRAGQDSSESTAVLYLDLDDFKQVNDVWGHETGDMVLIAVSRILEDSVRGSDTVARLGGDEFGVVLAHLPDPDAPRAAAGRIVERLRDPLIIGDRVLSISASVGIAVLGPQPVGPDELLRRANLAMLHGKGDKSNSWRLFAAGMDRERSPGTPTAAELEAAIVEGQLHLQYQPIVALGDGRLLGVEALVRWSHPTLGPLGPQAFVPLAERTGLIHRLGRWVLHTGCSQAREWQRRDSRLSQLKLNINLSPRQLDQAQLASEVMEVLRDTGLSPHHLVLEITENALVHEGLAVDIMAELRDRKIRIALDDFGTGYSSLRYLTRLPVDVLKLDRCFVAELNGTSGGSVIAEAVLRLGQALDIETVAEGIERPDQAAELAGLGYQAAQGYLFAKPLDPEDVDRLIDDVAPGATITLRPKAPAPVPGSRAKRQERLPL